MCSLIFSQLKFINSPLGFPDNLRYDNSCALKSEIIVSTAFNSTIIKSFTKTSNLSSVLVLYHNKLEALSVEQLLEDSSILILQ